MTTHVDREQLGARIQKLREACGLTQDDLADRLGMTRQFVSLLERGESSPHFDVLQKIVSECDTDLSKLLDWKVPRQYTNAKHRRMHQMLQEILKDRHTENVAVGLISWLHSQIGRLKLSRA